MTCIAHGYTDIWRKGCKIIITKWIRERNWIALTWNRKYSCREQDIGNCPRHYSTSRGRNELNFLLLSTTISRVIDYTFSTCYYHKLARGIYYRLTNEPGESAPPRLSFRAGEINFAFRRFAMRIGWPILLSSFSSLFSLFSFLLCSPAAPYKPGYSS